MGIIIYKRKEGFTTNKKQQLTIESLTELYCNQKKTIKEIANIYSISTSTVYEHLKFFNIERRKRGESVNHLTLEKKLPKDALKDLYFNQSKSLNEIGRMFEVGCTTVRHLMDKYEMKRRPPIRQSKFKNEVDANTLKSLYWEQVNSTREIAKKLGMSQSTVRKLMLELGIDTRKGNDAYKRPLQQKLSEETLRHLYVDLQKSSIEISELTGERSQSIIKLLKRYNISARSYTEANHIRFSRNPKINVNFFKKESCELFYLLGLLSTDGYISDDNVIGLGLTDWDVIDFVANIIGYKNQIHIEHVDRCFVMEKLIEGPKPRYKIKFQSKEVADVLKKYCIISRKSLILECPRIPDIYIADFIRGVIDGDGWVQTKPFNRTDGIKLTRVRIGIGSASEKFIVGIKTYIEKLIGGDRNIYCDKNGRMFRYIITYKEDVIRLTEKLYENNAFGMARKKEKLLAIIDERCTKKYIASPRLRNEYGRFCKLQ